MYLKYSMSAKCQSFFVREMPLVECPPLSPAVSHGYCMYQYHVPTKIKKSGSFYLGETTFFEPAAALYILIMEYYPDTNSRANLNIHFWYCQWNFRGVRLLITRQQNIGAMAKHRLSRNWSVPWTIGKYVTKNWVHAMIPYKCTFF